MEKTFYEISSSGTMLREGSYLDIQRSLVYRGDHADFTSFLDVPIKELETQLKASKAEEQKIYGQLKEAAKAWDEHGAQTLLLEKAIEYLKVPEVKHTANEWKQQEDGSWEISNLVYKMTFSIVKFGDEWKLSWELSYTAPGLSMGYWEYTRSPRQRIEYEGSKKYKTLEGAQKYIQSKFDQYANYFETISPRIPKEAKPLFSVNGQLLQGYAIMRQTKKEDITLDDLMAQLDASFPTEAPQEHAETDRNGDTVQEQPPSAVPKALQTEKTESGKSGECSPEQPPTLEALPRLVLLPEDPQPTASEPSLPKEIRPSHKQSPLHKKRAAMVR